MVVGANFYPDPNEIDHFFELYPIGSHEIKTQSAIIFFFFFFQSTITF